MNSFLVAGLLHSRIPNCLNRLEGFYIHQFDMDGATRRIGYTPGLFRPISQSPMYAAFTDRRLLTMSLTNSSGSALHSLAEVLSDEDERAMQLANTVIQTVAQGADASQYAQILAALLLQSSRTTAIASDLAVAEIGTLRLLRTVLDGRYSRACSAIRRIIAFREARNQTPDLVPLALAAVLDMAAGEDASDSD